MAKRDASVIDVDDGSSAERSRDCPAFLEADHGGSWSANLERDRYADDRETLIEHALAAIDRTRSGYHVNLVTHPDHGTPDAYLESPIRDRYPDAEATVVDQCGCGGYVYRVTVP